MSNFHFCAYNHNPIGRDTLFDMFDWLRAGLEENGHNVTYSHDRFEPMAINVIWEHFPENFADVLEGIDYGIIVTEYIDGEGFNFGNPRIGGVDRRDAKARDRWVGFLRAAAGAKFFWSMVETNVSWLRRIAPASFFELGFSDRLLPSTSFQPDIDFSFTGLMTPYRLSLLERLSAKAKVQFVDRLLPIAERDRVIQRTKINLSINKTPDWQMPSPTRIGRVVLSRRGIACEYTPQVTRQSSMVPVCPEGRDFADFAQMCLADDWQGKAELALERYRAEMPMAVIARRAIEESGL